MLNVNLCERALVKIREGLGPARRLGRYEHLQPSLTPDFDSRDLLGGRRQPNPTSVLWPGLHT